MRTKNAKQTILFFVIFILLFIGIIYFTSIQVHNHYKQEFIEQQQNIISGILKEYPELEEELTTILLEKSKTNNLGKNFFDTYGIDLESYESVGNIFSLKHYMIQKLLILFLAIVLLFSYFFYQYFKKEQKEIKQITDYLNHILSGDYSLEIHEYDEGEISTLKNDIYKITMLLREQDAYSKNEKKHLESVLSDISHQLKTPLTSMYVINDILENDEIDSNKKKEMLHKNRNQLERIEWLVSSLLKLSRLDSGVVIMKPQKVSVRKLLDQALEPMQIPIELKEQTIEIIGEEELQMEVDLSWTVEAFVNLIKNAYEHTPNQGKIQIRYIDNPIYIEFQFEDSGEGICKEDLPHIFERFYKGKSSNKDSIGIGLNMASTIIQKQNGVISVESIRNKGTIFTIKFYKNVI